MIPVDVEYPLIPNFAFTREEKDWLNRRTDLMSEKKSSLMFTIFKRCLVAAHITFDAGHGQVAAEHPHSGKNCRSQPGPGRPAAPLFPDSRADKEGME